MIHFTNEPMQTILPRLQQYLENEKQVTFSVLNPDLYESYAGNVVSIQGTDYLHRGYKAWCDLAELLHCKILTPQEATPPCVTLTFVKLKKEDSFHLHQSHSALEKYGTNSPFAKIHKMEEPAFLYYYLQALKNVHLSKRSRILNLGINSGDEFVVIKSSLPQDIYKTMELVGVDHSQSAISKAREHFPESNVLLHAADINHLDRLSLGKFDLLLSIGTLQSLGIAFKPFFMQLVQTYLKKDAAIILGFPNSRWIGGEMVYGAKAPNYAMSEMSLLLNDVIFCKKYLQQKKFRVTITGKQYLFLTATKIGLD